MRMHFSMRTHLLSRHQWERFRELTVILPVAVALCMAQTPQPGPRVLTFVSNIDVLTQPSQLTQIFA